RGTRLTDLLQGLGAHVEALGMHDVFAQLLYADRLEGARSDVQGNECVVHALQGEHVQHVFVEVQAGRGRGDGARLPSIDCLIATVVVFTGVVGNVRGRGVLPCASSRASTFSGKRSSNSSPSRPLTSTSNASASRKRVPARGDLLART